jgi:hypothetical protein
MAIANHEEGTYTDTPSSTWDSIQTTSPNTTDGVFIFRANLSNLVAGETFEMRIQVKDAAAGTVRTVWQGCWANAQSVPLKQSPPIPVANDWDFQMRQPAGTGRAVAWSIVKVT